jgi:(S)-2-hydroxyglutarate dehydrogenase
VPALDSASLAAQAPSRCDVAIVGGGVLGLAIARELGRRRPRASVCVIERERELAAHQTAHSSGVIHSGIYYLPGSLKARLCVQGARELYEYCEQRGVAHERCGKLILATSRAQLASLQELERRGTRNGVRLRRVDRAGIERIEPHARGLAGVHSPDTGVVDFRTVARAYAADVLDAGGTIVCGCAVIAAEPSARALRLLHAHGATDATHAIFCAGAWADRLAVAAGARPDPRIVPFRGAYMRLLPARRQLVRSLIYPVPDPALPFLGLHLTRHLDGEVTLGPSAVIAGARDGYRGRAARAPDLLETLAWPGTWRLLARHWPTALQELHRLGSRAAFAAAAAAMLPALTPGDLERGFAGVRAQALARDGQLVEDFAFSITGRALHVRNAPSPAATASLAIARHVCEQAERAFALAR